MSTTTADYPTQVGRLPVIDPRFYGCKGDGVNDDTGAIQTALDTAGIATTLPCVVQLPRGRFRTTTVLKFHNDGIILQGYSMMGEGETQQFGLTDNIPSVLFAGTSTQHDATPMLRISPGDGPAGQQWYRGSSVRNVGFDVSQSTRWSTGTPQPVLHILGCSNCPEFQELSFWGGIGTHIRIEAYHVNVSTDAVSENLRFINCFMYGGQSAAGTLNAMPATPGIQIIGADNIQFDGGLCAYNFGTLFASQNTGPTGAPAGPFVANNLSDVPAIQIIPGLLQNGQLSNLINGGCSFKNFFVTNYVVGCRISSVNVGGTVYCPYYCVFERFNVENYNKVFQVNQEFAGSDAGFWKTELFVRSCMCIGNFAGYGGSNGAGYPPYASTALLLQGSNLVGGHIEAGVLHRDGDVALDTTCTGVYCEVSGSRNSFLLFKISDSGANNIVYSKNGLAGRIMNGETRLLATADPNATSSTPAGTRALSCWGDTIKIADFARIIPSFNGAAGQFGDMCIGFSSGVWYLYICVQSGTVGNANWTRWAGQNVF